MITASDKFKCHGKEGILGPIIKYKNVNRFITTYHALNHKNDLNNMVTIDNIKGKAF